MFRVAFTTVLHAKRCLASTLPVGIGAERCVSWLSRKPLLFMDHEAVKNHTAAQDY